MVQARNADPLHWASQPRLECSGRVCRVRRGASFAIVRPARGDAGRAAGTLVAVALGWTPAAFDTHTFVARGQRMVSACASGNKDFARSLGLIASGTANVEPLISERVPLAEGPAAFVRLQHPGNL